MGEGDSGVGTHIGKNARRSSADSLSALCEAERAAVWRNLRRVFALEWVLIHLLYGAAGVLIRGPKKLLGQ